MSRAVQQYRVPVLAVTAAMALCFPALLAQPDDAEGDKNPAMSRLSSDAQRGSDPTPEEVGDALMLHQRYQAAIEAYEKSGPGSARVWNKMGIAHQMMFNVEAALRCYRESIRLDKNNASALNNLGTLYNSQKDFSHAERAYRRAVALAPRDAVAYKNLGTVLLTEHKYEKGWEAYRTALALNSKIFENNPGPRADNPGSSQERGAMNYYMARGCAHAGMNDCAIDYLRRALNEGFASAKKIQADSEFAGMRGLAAYVQLLAAQERR